jgi:hypothetical protein
MRFKGLLPCWMILSKKPLTLLLAQKEMWS